MLDKLTKEDFAGLVDREVSIRFGDTTQSARVSEVQQSGTGKPGGREPFSVIVLTGTAEQYWPQGVYQLDHPEHGALELFMVPIGLDQDRMRYEISFS